MKRIVTVFCLISMVLSTAACSHIEDTNGDDTSLVTIDDEKLASTSISATSSGFSSNSVRDNITLIDQDEEIDLDALEMDGGPSSGVSDIMATGLKEGQTFAVYVESEVREGNLEIVLLSPDNEILYKFTTGEADIAEFVVDQEGTYNIRMGTESFNGYIYVERLIDG